MSATTLAVTPRSFLVTLFQLVLLTLLLAGCISHQQYRTDYELCTAVDLEKDCASSTLQAYEDPNASDSSYLLGFVELDDQGQLWDRGQLKAVHDYLYEQSAEQDLLMVVFVHGWKHSAAVGDSNIQSFRQALKRLSEMESLTNAKPRAVVGVYLGWRGGSVSTPVLKELTFWDRKKTAHKVGNGGVTEILSQLELIKKTKAEIAAADKQESATRLIVVGHSFGGAVVYSAVNGLLDNGFVQTRGPDAVASDAVGFSDLVVLINPAFEAMHFASLRDMANARPTYFENQLPVLAVLTSEADYATKYAFPVGRWFSTLFEKTREVDVWNPVSKESEEINQGAANLTALGHFDSFKTHYLQATETIEERAAIGFNPDTEVTNYLKASDKWETDHPGSSIEFSGSTLHRTDNSAGRNPYLIVRVDKELIRDHNDINDPRIGAFIRQLVLISSQSRDFTARGKRRSSALKMQKIRMAPVD